MTSKSTTVTKKQIYTIINRVSTAQADYNRTMLNLTAVLFGAYANHHQQSWTKESKNNLTNRRLKRAVEEKRAKLDAIVPGLTDSVIELIGKKN